MPALLENYERIAEKHPNWSYAYLGAVVAGALVLGANEGAIVEL